ALIAGILILVAWTTFDVSEAFLYQGGFAIHAVLVAVVVLTAVQPGPVRTVLSIEPLRRLGLISYGVYLYHWPIFLWLTPARTGRDGLSLFGLRLVVTLGAAM